MVIYSFHNEHGHFVEVLRSALAPQVPGLDRIESDEVDLNIGGDLNRLVFRGINIYIYLCIYIFICFIHIYIYIYLYLCLFMYLYIYIVIIG